MKIDEYVAIAHRLINESNQKTAADNIFLTCSMDIYLFANGLTLTCSRFSNGKPVKKFSPKQFTLIDKEDFKKELQATLQSYLQ